MDKIKKHSEICNELTEIYTKKNKDYGNSFGETFNKLGLISAVTRISDKYNRLCNLAINNNPEIKDETITDTLIDLANYCIMTLIEMDCQEIDNKNSKEKVVIKAKNSNTDEENEDNFRITIQEFINK